jgi:UDP-glucose 4-epimerase
VIELARAVTGHAIPAVVVPRRPGDPARLVASSERAGAVLDWQPRKQALRVILEDAWAWRRSHPNGYAR